MRSQSPSAALVVVILAGFALVFAQAATIPIIWQFYNSPPPTVNAKCGDTLAFQVSGQHDVIQVASKSCTATTIKVWAPDPAPALVSVPITMAGTTYYLCNVGTHCKDFNMLIQVTATGPCPGATPSPSPKAVSPSPSPKAVSPSPSPKAVSPSPSPKAVSPSPSPKAVSPSPSPKAVSPSPKAASPSPAAKSPTPAPAASPKPAPMSSPKSPSPKRSPPNKKPAPCHAKPPPCKKSRAHGK